MQNGRLFDVPSMNEVMSSNNKRKPFFFDADKGMATFETMASHGHD